MEKYFNYFEKRLIAILEENLKVSRENNELLKSLLTQDSNKQNKFDILTKKAAQKYLNCSKESLDKSIQKEELVENIHYRFNGKRTWLFSKAALEPLRGKL